MITNFRTEEKERAKKNSPSSKHGEPGTDPAPGEGVGGDGAVGVHEVHVDEVVEALHEYDEDPGADGDDADDLRPRVYGGVRGPGEPEEARWHLLMVSVLLARRFARSWWASDTFREQLRHKQRRENPHSPARRRQT